MLKKALYMMLIFACLTFSPALAESEGIGWIPTWKQALSEAARTHRPILLVAAAPHCEDVPGVW